MVSSGSSVTLRATMIIVVLLALSATNAVCGQNQCNDDQDCSSKQYCYNVSHICVNFTQCERHNRMEAAAPARQPSQCGPCIRGYEAEIFLTGELAPLCKQIKVLQESAGEAANVDIWTGVWIGCTILICLIIVILIVCLANKIKKCSVPKVSASRRFFEKVSFRTARPTAPPQDDALYHLRGPSYPDEEQPPVYASVIGPSVDKDQLVNATPTIPPTWVAKPIYEPDYNDNVADGAAIPIHSSSTTLQMELDEEGETNPSSWTPEQVTVDLPIRPFALFNNSEQFRESTSDDSSEIPEEASGSRMRGGIYCGPNVQINQTITLNIAKNGTK